MPLLMSRHSGPAPAVAPVIHAFAGAIAALLISTSIATAETLTVEAQGTGPSRSDAISAALTAAVEQVSGLKIEARAEVQQEFKSAATGSSDRSVTLQESQQTAVKRAAGGVVKSYEIISVGSNNSTFDAVLSVNIERYNAPGLATQDRRRIVVALPQNLAELSPPEIATLRDALEAYFIQTRRFSVLDRQNDSAYRSEIELLQSRDVPVTETMRLGQVIGTDYVLLTKVRRFETATEVTILPITNQRANRNTASAAADFSILEVATRQVKWAGQAVLETSVDRAGALHAFASRIGGLVLNDIYPLRVVQILRPNSVVINQGADTIKIGQIFSANRLGDMDVDPYTKEPLGRTETRVGAIQITRVDPKLSYGDLISGALPDDGVDIILREQNGTEPQTLSAPTTNANTGPRPRW
ncbi:hypothetical protein M2322_004554 [Rhodoblastus acidophilus]|uniref:hypothetical protein n=1 Tax=Rhodoblastus acidophilus TaxID=1074 RepID=UPI00222437DA|nr:hypothetical protein [Rhodoblastus acidophilus]MCW2318985.1 hypothetical protein [Rhodoblastus acidophilus]